MFEWEVIDVINNTLGIFIFVDKTQNTFIYERGFFLGGGVFYWVVSQRTTAKQ